MIQPRTLGLTRVLYRLPSLPKALTGSLTLPWFAVGVLVDYFAASALELDRADHFAGPASMGWPYVDCKGWINGLTDLVAELTERDRSEFGDDEQVSGGEEGPWLARVRPEVVVALAGVSDERLAEYAEEELLFEYEAGRNVQLRDLARSARESGRDLYCWVSF